MKFRSLFPRRDIVIELAEKGCEEGAILLAWSVVEMNIDNAILREKGMSTHDPRHKKLLIKPIEEKIREQRRLGYLSQADAEKLWTFKDKRDCWFHKGGLFFSAMTQEKKDAAVRIAIKAKDVSHLMFDQAYSPPIPPTEHSQHQRRNREGSQHQ